MDTTTLSVQAPHGCDARSGVQSSKVVYNRGHLSRRGLERGHPPKPFEQQELQGRHK